MDPEALQRILMAKKRAIEARLAKSSLPAESSVFSATTSTFIKIEDSSTRFRDTGSVSRSPSASSSSAPEPVNYAQSASNGAYPGSSHIPGSAGEHSNKDIFPSVSVIIQSLAQSVARAGPAEEARVRHLYLDHTSPLYNSDYQFLTQTQSPAYQLYQQRIRELKQGNGVKVEGVAGESAVGVKRKRQSRWDPKPESDAGVEVKVEPAASAVLPEEYLRALELAQLKQKLAVKDATLKTIAGVVDTDPPGTSNEHKMRAMEMAKTKELAEKLTKPLHEGKHHLQDFIPKEELDKFQQRVQNPGGSVPGTQYEENKLDASNVGFQMLKKFGWTEGQGLGASGSGIAAPVASTVAVERAGLGTKRPDEPSEDDDEFSLYRKRMMLAYKYRPNPLNNPRRPYY